jgi:hypothetical protein
LTTHGAWRAASTASDGATHLVVSPLEVHAAAGRFAAPWFARQSTEIAPLNYSFVASNRAA